MKFNFWLKLLAVCHRVPNVHASITEPGSVTQFDTTLRQCTPSGCKACVEYLGKPWCPLPDAPTMSFGECSRTCKNAVTPHGNKYQCDILLGNGCIPCLEGQTCYVVNAPIVTYEQCQATCTAPDTKVNVYQCGENGCVGCKRDQCPIKGARVCSYNFCYRTCKQTKQANDNYQCNADGKCVPCIDLNCPIPGELSMSYYKCYETCKPGRTDRPTRVTPTTYGDNYQCYRGQCVPCTNGNCKLPNEPALTYQQCGIVCGQGPVDQPAEDRYQCTDEGECIPCPADQSCEPIPGSNAPAFTKQECMDLCTPLMVY